MNIKIKHIKFKDHHSSSGLSACLLLDLALDVILIAFSVKFWCRRWTYLTGTKFLNSMQVRRLDFQWRVRILHGLNSSWTIVSPFFLIVYLVFQILAKSFWLGRYKPPHRFGLHQGHGVCLNVRRWIGSSVWVNTVRVEISSIDKASINRFCISSSVVFKRRFSEVSHKWTVWNPSGGLLELKMNKKVPFR